MRIAPIILAVLLFAMVFMACSGGSGEQGDVAALPIHGLVLDGGQKWQMDPTMAEIMSRMVNAAGAEGIDDLDTGGCQALGEELQSHLDDLIKSCNMGGQAHEQLHIFLTVYMPVVDSLRQHGDAEDIPLVRGFLATYQAHFQ